MAHCSIVNSTVETVLNKLNINTDKFIAYLDVINDIIDPYNKNSFNIINTYDTNVLEQILPKINKFLEHPYHQSFLDFVKTNYPSALKNIYDNKYKQTGNQWLSYVEAFNYLSDKWEKFAKTKTKVSHRRQYNISEANRLKNTSNIKDRQKENELIESIEKETIEILGDNEKLNVSNDSYKVIMSEFFGININNLDFNLPLKEFISQLNNEINRVKEQAKNNKDIAKITKIINNYNKAKEEYKTTNNNNRKKELNTIIHNAVNTLAESRESAIHLAVVHSKINSTNTVLDLVKDRILSDYHKRNDNVEEKGEHNLTSMFFPYFEKNKITDKQWDEFYSKVNTSSSISALLGKFALNKAKESNPVLFKFLESLGKQDFNPTPVIERIDTVTSDGSPLYKKLENYKKIYGSYPSAMYVTNSFNNASKMGWLKNDFGHILIFDHGEGNRNISTSMLLHEWLHGLTQYSFINDTGGFNQTVEILRNHALKAYKSNSIDMTGIDTTKLNIINGIPYALTNGRELVAEVFTNTELQKLLDRINSPFEHKEKKSLFKWFLDKIQSLIKGILEKVGHKKGTDTVLTELLITGATSMQFNMSENERDINDIVNSEQYGTNLSPAILPEISEDLQNIASDLNDITSTELELIGHCNTVVTPLIDVEGEIKGKVIKTQAPYEFSQIISEYNDSKDGEELLNNTNYNQDTIAALYIKDDVYQTEGKEVAERLTRDVINSAKQILNLGGRCVTLSKEYLDNNAMSNIANANIYQVLLNNGYKPYDKGDTTVWVQEKISDEEKEEFSLDAATVKKLTPECSVDNNTCIINPDVILLHQLKQGENKLEIKSNSPLYDKVKALNKGIKLKVYGDNRMYYGSVNNIEISDDSTIVITTNFQLTAYNDIDVRDIDFSAFYSEDIKLPENNSMEVKLGSQIVEWRKNMIADALIFKIRLKLLDYNPYSIGLDNTEENKLNMLFKKESFDTIKEELRKEYEDYINGTDEYRLNEDIKSFKREVKKFALDVTSEQVERRAKKISNVRLEAYKKMMPYFDDLVRLAAKKVSKTFNLGLNYFSNLIDEDDNALEDDNDGSIYEQTDSNDNIETSDDSEESSQNSSEEDNSDEENVIGKDHWVVSSSNQDIHDTVNIKIKKILSDINQATSDGYTKYDDLGNVLYIDERDVFADLLNITKGSRNIEDMLSKIEDYASHGHAEFYAIVDTVKDNSELESLFFNGLCSQRKEIESVVKTENGTFLKHNNKDSKEEWVINSAIDSINSKQSGSINDIDGSVIATTLYKELMTSKITKDEVSDSDIEKMQGWLKKIGIFLTTDDIQKTVYENVSAYNNAIDTIMDIAKYCIKNKNSIASTSNYYKNLAKVLNFSIPVTQTVRTYTNGKMYPSYNHPSYISRMIVSLSNKSLKERQAFMDKEFKQFSQYYTKDNLQELISTSNSFAKEDVRYAALTEWLRNLENIKEKFGDKEVSARIRDEARSNTPISDLLNTIPTFKEGFWNFLWLEKLYNYQDVNIGITDMNSYDGVPYTRLNETQQLQVMLLKFSQKNTAFSVPTYADANCWNFISFKKAGIDKILDGFEKIMLSEIERVKQVRERHELRLKAFKEFNSRIKKEPNLSLGDIEYYSYPIPNWDIETKIKYKSNGSIDIEKSSEIEKSNALNYQYYNYDPNSALSMREQIKQQIENEFLEFRDYVNSLGLENIMPDNQLYEFYFEHCFATANILALTSSPVFYKNAIDFQKRFKEVYAMTSRINVNAKGGKKWEYSITIKDSIVNDFKDVAYKEIGKCISKILNQSKHLTPASKKYIKSKLAEINVADAQCFRTPQSYIAIKKMLGEFGEDAQSAWVKLNSKKLDIKSFNLIMGVLKPFLRSNYIVSSKTSYGDIKVPVQRKNSEFMSPYGSNYNLTQAKNPVLQALTDFMEKYHIDSANFESAVKTGNQAPIDLSECKNYQDTIEMLHKATGIDKNLDTEKLAKDLDNATDIPVIIGNPEVVKITPFEDYGLVAPNPEHFIDKKVKISNQFRRVMQSNINLDEDYEIETVEYKKVKDGQEYSREKDKMIDRYVLKKIVTKKKIKGKELRDKYTKLVQDNLSDSFKKIEDLFSDNGKLAAFLSEKVMNDDMLSEDVKDLIRRDKNGHFTNMVDPNHTEQIHKILMSKFRKTVTEQKMAGGTCVQVSTVWSDDIQLHFKEDSDGNTVIDYADCYLPCYMKQWYSIAINDDGILSLDKLRKFYEDLGDMETYDALVSMVGYRTPCEGISSCIPLRIKGFLPPNSGSCVVLPKEITYLSGSDFDVDKLYILRRDFKLDKDNIPRLIKGDSIRGRNNQWLDLVLQLFSTKQYTEQFFDGSNFDELKKSVNIMNIIENAEELPMSVSDLKKLSPDDVEDIAKQYKGKKQNLNILDPKTELYFHTQNFTGKELLSVWAVYKSVADMMQYCDLNLRSNFVFTLNGEKYQKLCPTTVKDGKTNKYLTKLVGPYLAAAADNTKDPVLYKLGITKDNVNTVGFLSLMGVDSTSIALLIKASKLYEGDVSNIDYTAITPYLATLTDDKLAKPDDRTIECAAYLMTKAQKAGESLSLIISALRADSVNGALKKDIYSTISFKQKIEKAITELNNSDVFYSANPNVPVIDDTGLISSGVQNTSQSGYLQQFLDYGINSYFDKTSDLFAEFNNTFEDAFSLKYITKNGYMSSKTVKDVMQHLYYYHTLSLPFFGNTTINGKDYTAQERIDIYKNKMPDYFKKMMSEYPELYNNEFLKRLQINYGDSGRELIFPNAFQYNKETVLTIKNALNDLFINDNLEIRQFAWELLRYSFYRQGFSRKSNGYGHLFAKRYYDAIPGYKQLMRNLQSGSISNGSFKTQFLNKKTNFTKELVTVTMDELAKDLGEAFKTTKINSATICNYVIKKYSNSIPDFVRYGKKVYNVKAYMDGKAVSPIIPKEELSFISYSVESMNISLDNVKLNNKNESQNIIGNVTEGSTGKSSGFFEERSNNDEEVC